MAQQQLSDPEYKRLLQDHQEEQEEMAKNQKQQRRTARRPSPLSRDNGKCPDVRVAPADTRKAGKGHRCPETVRLRKAVVEGFLNPYAKCSICPVSGRVIPEGQAFHIPTKSPSNVSSVLHPAKYIEGLKNRSLQCNFGSPAAAIAAIRCNTELTEAEKAVLTEYVIKFYNCHPQTVEKAVVTGLAAYYAGDAATLQAAFAPTEIDLLNVGGIVTFASTGRSKKKGSKDAAAASSEDEAEIPQLDPSDIKLNEPLDAPEGVTIADLASVFAQADEVLFAGQ